MNKKPRVDLIQKTTERALLLGCLCRMMTDSMSKSGRIRYVGRRKKEFRSAESSILPCFKRRKCILYKVPVLPVLKYCCHLWCPTNQNVRLIGVLEKSKWGLLSKFQVWQSLTIHVISKGWKYIPCKGGHRDIEILVYSKCYSSLCQISLVTLSESILMTGKTYYAENQAWQDVQHSDWRPSVTHFWDSRSQTIQLPSQRTSR